MPYHEPRLGISPLPLNAPKEGAALHFVGPVEPMVGWKERSCGSPMTNQESHHPGRCACWESKPRQRRACVGFMGSSETTTCCSRLTLLLPCVDSAVSPLSGLSLDPINTDPVLTRIRPASLANPCWRANWKCRWTNAPTMTSTPPCEPSPCPTTHSGPTVVRNIGVPMKKR